MSGGSEEEDRRRIVVVGSFDLLHRGHVEMLRAARSRGDELVALVRDDAWVERSCGPGWPVSPGDDRVGVLAALRWVDEARLVAEDELDDVLALLRPDLVLDDEADADTAADRSRTEAIVERARGGATGGRAED